MARSCKRICRDCGFMAPLAGALGVMFGVCCSEMSADGHVVDLFYGCGAHSGHPAPAGSGSPAYEPYDDGSLEVVEVERVPPSRLKPPTPNRSPRLSKNGLSRMSRPRRAGPEQPVEDV